jgi:hypothetical protein
MWKFVEHPYTALSSMCLFAMTTYLLFTRSEVNRTPLSESDYHPPMAIIFVMQVALKCSGGVAIILSTMNLFLTTCYVTRSDYQTKRVVLQFSKQFSKYGLVSSCFFLLTALYNAIVTELDYQYYCLLLGAVQHVSMYTMGLFLLRKVFFDDM